MAKCWGENKNSEYEEFISKQLLECWMVLLWTWMMWNCRGIGNYTRKGKCHDKNSEAEIWDVCYRKMKSSVLSWE